MPWKTSVTGCWVLRSDPSLPDAGGTPTTLIVTLDLEDLRAKTGYAVASDGTLIPTDKAVRLADQADISYAAVDAKGVPLRLGRSRRIATLGQTAALIARDKGCSFPGCDVAPEYCERHHITAWIDGGSTDLDKVGRVCRTVGRELEPEQALAVDVLTGVRADGTPASLSACVISARQNLKKYVLENIVLTRLLDPTEPGRLFIWTAQQLDTCQETFLHFKDMFESDDFPYLQRRLVNIANGHGDEEIELVGGKRLKFKARSRKSGQGLTGDLIVLDEAFALESAHLGSLVPTLSTRPRAAILYGSSAGHGSSEVLRGVRDRGRQAGPGSPAYIEWCAPGSLENPGCAMPGCSHLVTMQGCVLDRRELIQLANPMAGRRISWDYLRDERRELPPLEYARERLGWWDEPDSAAAPPISVEDWRHQLDPGSAVAEGGKIVLDAEIAMDRRSGSIGVAGWRDDGAAHVGLIWHQQGTEQLLPALLGFIERNELHELKRGR